ncbi:hypothetical protein SAMN05444007_10737 [Cribrihabitans marinus]|uniref:Uncharacterized protein n=1 Tax=Cribrihabitans marinus TaxID=1227549 RepID=A0A1H7BPX3_9RHOB|nr:hypothetical protein [Cribrihabitans marinus]GGH34563.1 hypothetical protein GCM10010973_27340 [Cribrihabitans marinus]SEJ76642.1 hypothetical protein SAMN05444007_10737 [Cribrihabitans marinus]
MAERKPPEKGNRTGSEREERLKAALKANLARRKAQTRARAGSGTKTDKNEG